MSAIERASLYWSSVLREPLLARRTILGVAMGTAAVAQLLGIPVPLLARWLINHPAVSGDVQAVSGVASPYWAFGIAVLSVGIARACFRWAQSALAERFAQGVIADLRVRMHRTLLRLPQGYFDRRPLGKILVRFSGDCSALKSWLAGTLITAPADVLLVLGLAITLAVMRPSLLLAALIPACLIIPVMLIVSPAARQLTREGRRHQAQLCGAIEEQLTRLVTIAASNNQQHCESQVASLTGSIADAAEQRARREAWVRATSIFTTTLAVGAVGFVGAFHLRSGGLNHGDVVAAVWLSLLVRGPINRLSRAGVSHQRARVSLERIGTLLDRKQEPGWDGDLRRTSKPITKLEFRNVSYKPKHSGPMIRDLSITLSTGSLLAVSDDVDGRAARCVFDLILRVRRPHTGYLQVDNVSARKWHVGGLRGKIGFVDRDRSCIDTQLRSRTVGSAQDDALVKGVWQQTKHLSGDTHDDSYATVLARVASFTQEAMSPGLRIRLAFCSALAGNPSILLIEHPFLNLDETQCELLEQCLVRLAADRIVLITVNPASRMSIEPDSLHISASGDVTSRRPKILDFVRQPMADFVTDGTLS